MSWSGCQGKCLEKVLLELTAKRMSRGAKESTVCRNLGHMGYTALEYKSKRKRNSSYHPLNIYLIPGIVLNIFKYLYTMLKSLSVKNYLHFIVRNLS